MASIEDVGDGRFRVRWRDPDGSSRKKLFGVKTRSEDLRRKSERAANAFLVEVTNTLRTGRAWRPPEVRTVPDLGLGMTTYLEHLKGRGAARSTIRNAGVALKVFQNFAGDLSKLLVSELTVGKLDAFYKWMAKDNGRHDKVRSLDSRKKYVGQVQLWWRFLASNERFADFMKPPARLEGLATDPGTPTKAGTWAEMDAAIACGGLWYPLPMATMRALGLRVSQTMLLRVGDVRFNEDQSEAELVVRGELGKSKQERRGRIVPIAPAVLPLLKLLCEGRSADTWLVPTSPWRKRGERRDREIRTPKVREAWIAAGVREEVWKRRPDHAFRKGFNTGLRNLGAEHQAVEHLLGHSLGLAGIYTDETALKMREAVALMPPFSADAWAAIERALSTTNSKEQ